ncbi:bidirectional sugar transporter SWEET17 [Dendrobium catenatum]|uniref:bidirectional sugar transporter SWEET17 n=1 Tax=Dendrobium catenatum TaxID=906689 RepID=UPI0009F2A952|nr:bidirectional sugar transporter SWEET17 [Dendrobium catenatum]
MLLQKMVVRTKSVEYMPFFLSFFLMLNGGIWTLYALLDSDFFLGISNGIGFILGIIQLTLYIIYMNPKVPKHLNIAVEEHSQQHQRLIFPNIDAHKSTDDEERGTSPNE